MVRLLVFCFIISGISCIAQTGSITGEVTSEGKPLPGVNVTVLDTRLGGFTSPDGKYSISNIPAGKYDIKFSAIGYENYVVGVEIVQNRILELNAELQEKVIEVGLVEVTGEKIQEVNDTRTSLIDLKPQSARILPGAVTDVFRTLQSMPGVLAPNDFSSQLVVRGSGPDQNLIVMDDVEIFNPYRLYGVISMFNPEAVSDVNLITGGFPVRYGDRLSAVLDVTNQEGPSNKSLSGNINASIVSANLVLGGKNPFSIPGSWLVNSRRTYYDLIIEPFVKNAGLVDENVSFPNFYDVQAKLVFGPFGGHKFLLNGIYSRDGVNLVSSKQRTNPDSVGIFNLTRNDVVSLAWHYVPNKKLFNKIVLSWYDNSGNTNFNSEFLDPSLNRENYKNIAPDTLAPYLYGFGFDSQFKFRKYSFEDRFTYFWDTNNELEIGAGLDVMQTLLTFEFNIDPELRIFLNTNPNFRTALENIGDKKEYSRQHIYVQNNFALTKDLFVQPGIRLDHYNLLNKYYISPRLSVSYALDDITTARAVWGIYYQSPGYEKLLDRGIILDFTPENTADLEAEEAVHYVFSIERWISSEWHAKFESYYKKFNNLIEQKMVKGTSYFTELIPGKDPKYVNSWTRPVKIVSDSLTQIPLNNAYGESYGVEFLLEKRNVLGFDKINGWISYSLAFTNRIENGIEVPFRFDQRHTINVVLNYKFNDWLDAGVRFQYGSGFPLTEAVGIKPRIILVDNDGDLVPETPVIATGEDRGNSGENEVLYNVDFGSLSNRLSGRKPAYHRLDIRLSAAADFWDLDWIFYLDVINVYNHSNVINYDYYVTDDLKLDKEKTSMFPILPTLGFSVKF